MHPMIRVIAKMLGRTQEQAIANAMLIGLGCAVLAAVPVVLIAIWIALSVVGMLLRLIF